MPCAIDSDRGTPSISRLSCRCWCAAYYEGWRLAASQTKERTLTDFLEHVRSELPRGSGIDPNAAVRAVFGVMWEKLDLGEVGKVIDLLPAELKELWR